MRVMHPLSIGLVAAVAMLSACSKQETVPGNDTATTSIVQQPVVPPPPGDSTPKAADETARQASEANESTGAKGGSSQSTVGTAASGAPPYTVNGAPEGNVAPKAGDVPQK